MTGFKLILDKIVGSAVLRVGVPVLLCLFSIKEIVEDFDNFGAHHGVFLLGFMHLLHAIHFLMTADEALEKKD